MNWKIIITLSVTTTLILMALSILHVRRTNINLVGEEYRVDSLAGYPIGFLDNKYDTNTLSFSSKILYGPLLYNLVIYLIGTVTLFSSIDKIYMSIRSKKKYKLLAFPVSSLIGFLILYLYVLLGILDINGPNAKVVGVPLTTWEKLEVIKFTLPYALVGWLILIIISHIKAKKHNK